MKFNVLHSISRFAQMAQAAVDLRRCSPDIAGVMDEAVEELEKASGENVAAEFEGDEKFRESDEETSSNASWSRYNAECYAATVIGPQVLRSLQKLHGFGNYG